MKITTFSTLILTSTLLLGCQSTQLTEANGSGALLIPVEFDFENVGKHPCYKIGLEMGDELKIFTVDVNHVKNSIYQGYAIVPEITPGDYKITKFRCYPHPGRVFNKNEAYLVKKTNLHFAVKANQLLSTRMTLTGYNRKDRGDSTVFNITFSNHGSNAQDRTLDLLSKQPQPEGWEIIRD